MSKAASLRDMRPYHLLLLASLCAVALAMIAAMVTVTQHQVLKAQAHYAATPSATEAAEVSEPVEPTSRAGAVKVGYLLQR